METINGGAAALVPQIPQSLPSDVNISQFKDSFSIKSFYGDDSEAQFEDAIALIEATIAEMTAEQPPVLSVEGINLGSSVSSSSTAS